MLNKRPKFWDRVQFVLSVEWFVVFPCLARLRSRLQTGFCSLLSPLHCDYACGCTECIMTHSHRFLSWFENGGPHTENSGRDFAPVRLRVQLAAVVFIDLLVMFQFCFVVVWFFIEPIDVRDLNQGFWSSGRWQTPLWCRCVDLFTRFPLLFWSFMSEPSENFLARIDLNGLT